MSNGLRPGLVSVFSHHEGLDVVTAVNMTAFDKGRDRSLGKTTK
jgi:hypothetical protein